MSNQLSKHDNHPGNKHGKKDHKEKSGERHGFKFGKRRGRVEGRRHFIFFRLHTLMGKRLID